MCVLRGKNWVFKYITHVIQFLQSVNTDFNGRISCRVVQRTSNSYSGPMQVPGHLYYPLHCVATFLTNKHIKVKGEAIPLEARCGPEGG